MASGSQLVRPFLTAFLSVVNKKCRQFPKKNKQTKKLTSPAIVQLVIRKLFCFPRVTVQMYKKIVRTAHAGVVESLRSFSSIPYAPIQSRASPVGFPVPNLKSSIRASDRSSFFSGLSEPNGIRQAAKLDLEES